MITLEDFIGSFIGSKVPDDLIVDSITIDSFKEMIHVQGREYDSDGTLSASNYSIPFLKDADYEITNDAKQDVVRGK